MEVVPGERLIISSSQSTVDTWEWYYRALVMPPLRLEAILTPDILHRMVQTEISVA